MSDRHRQYDSKSSRRYEKNSSKSKSKKSSHSREDKRPRTPPLPSNNCDMDELLRKRMTLKEELKRLGETSDKNSKKHSRDERKRKHSDHVSSKTHTKEKDEKDKKKREKKAREPSPEVQEIHSNSEDEESIIEQRRIQRKQLLEKLKSEVPKVSLEEKNNENDNNEEKNSLNIEGNNQNSTSIKAAEKLTTDMFSEKDDFVPKQISRAVDKDCNNTQLTDNWDDADGYYNIRSGDIINKRYTIKDILGQGVFANVVRAQDNVSNSLVAIKIVRNNDLMYKTSLKEISILREIREADPDNKYHCVQFITHFTHKGHLCMVLESLHMDLRAIIKKYGKHHGIHMKALISYSTQLLLALRLLKKIGIVHADIKPDNIIVNENKNVLKLCDFGSAAKIDENEPTPYLVSRFYRAPEIILGIPYTHAIDIWSTACTIYEMATSKIMFTGNSNNGMLKCFMDLKGKISCKMIKKGKFKDQHFNYNNNFLMQKTDEFTGRDKVVEVSNHVITRDIYKELQQSCKNLSPGEEKKLLQMKDLLDKMLMLDPNQRATVSDCLRHPFISEPLEKK